jgi:hypothetical protein
MRRSLSLLVLVCWTTAVCFVVHAQAHPQPEEVTVFELYSWQDAKGEWTFGLFPAISSSGLHPDVIMRKSSALTGQDKLKRAIAALPAGSQIYWLDNSNGWWKNAKGWEHIKYPPAEVIADIRKYCETKRLRLSVE